MKELIIDAIIENIPVVTEFAEQYLEAAGCSASTIMQISVAIDEIFCNISSYAYAPSVGKATVRVDTEDDGRVATLTFIDSGIPFNPLLREEPDITLSAEERQIGGLGIFMVRKMMDEVLYSFEDGKNILTIKKAC